MKLNEIRREYQNQVQKSQAIYEVEIERLKAQLHESRSKEKELITECKDAKDELNNLQEQLQKAHREVLEKEQECMRLKSNLSVRLESTCTLNSEDQQIKELREVIAHYEITNEELKKEKEVVQDKCDLLQHDYDTLKTKYSNLKKQSKEQRSAQNSRHRLSTKSRDIPLLTGDEPDGCSLNSAETEQISANTNHQENITFITPSAENEQLRTRLENLQKGYVEVQLCLQQQVQYYREENCQLESLLEDSLQQKFKEYKDGFQVKFENKIISQNEIIQNELTSEHRKPISDLDEERKNNHMLQEILATHYKQIAIDFYACKLREEQYLQAIAKFKQENESLVETDFPETSDELMAQAILPSLTLKPSSYDETLALMKSQLDAVRESLKHTKRTPEASQAQNDLIKQLYTDLATLKVLKEQSEQRYNKEKTDLESCVESMAMKHQQEVAAINNELENERENIHVLSSQNAQTTLELCGYKDREEHYLQQIAKFKKENESLVETDFPETSDELIAQASLPPLTLKPSSYDETLAQVQSQLDALRKSLSHTKRTHSCAQTQNQLMKLLYKGIETLGILKEQIVEVYKKELEDLESNLHSAMFKCTQYDELEEDRRKIQEMKEMLDSQNSKMVGEIGQYKERELLHLQQIKELRESRESLSEMDIPDCNDESFSDTKESSHPLCHEETLGQMKSAMKKLRQSLSRAIQTSETLKQKEILVRKLSGDIDSLRSHDEQSSLLHSEEKAKLLLSINQCNEEIRLLRAHLETLTAKCCEAAQEVATSSNLIAKDHELLFKLQEKLTNKEAEVEKYKGELESVRDRQQEEVKVPLDTHDQEVSEVLRKDREIKRLQEQLRKHNSSKLDELTGEMNIEPEHLQPNRKMMQVDVSEIQQSAETISVHSLESKEVLRNTIYCIINLMKGIQTEVNSLRTLIQCSKDQFRSDVAMTVSQLKEYFNLLKQKEISSLVVQLMKQHEEEISELQEKLTLKCGSEVKTDLINMLNTKDHQLQEAKGRLELASREHEEQLMQLQNERRQLVEQYQAECKAKQDCEQTMKEIFWKHTEALTQAKTLAEEQTNSLKQLCTEAMNCSTDILQDYSHSNLIHFVRDEMKRRHEMLSEAQQIAQVQTESLQRLCIESAHCSGEMIQSLNYPGLLGCIKHSIEKMSDKHSSDLNAANTISELQTAHLKEFCISVLKCGAETVCKLNHAGTLDYLKDEIQRRMSKHCEAFTKVATLAEEQTNSLRQLCIEATNCSANTVQDYSHNGLVDLIRCEMKKAHEKHIRELNKAVHISEVQTDDLRELCNTAIGSEVDEELNSFTHEDLLRYIRVELEKIKDNLLQESTRAQLLGDELTVITQRYEGVESTLLEEHDEEVRSLCQQKDLLAQQLETMKDHYEQLLIQSSEQQGKLIEELQNAKGKMELALLQKTDELKHLNHQSEELRRERKVLLDIVKQLCSQFRPIELDNVI